MADDKLIIENYLQKRAEMVAKINCLLIKKDQPVMTLREETIAGYAFVEGRTTASEEAIKELQPLIDLLSENKS